VNAAAIVTDLARDRPSILVVEDEVLVRIGIAEELREQGFTVIEAAHADEALAVLQSDTPIDLVLTDVQMPGPLNGIGLARIVRAQFPGIRILVASGRVPQPDTTEGTIDGFFAKPYDYVLLIARIRLLLDSGTCS
jgi:DNA-binding response OmpR family regulator